MDTEAARRVIAELEAQRQEKIVSVSELYDLIVGLRRVYGLQKGTGPEPARQPAPPSASQAKRPGRELIEVDVVQVITDAGHSLKLGELANRTHVSAGTLAKRLRTALEAHALVKTGPRYDIPARPLRSVGPTAKSAEPIAPAPAVVEEREHDFDRVGNVWRCSGCGEAHPRQSEFPRLCRPVMEARHAS